MAKPSSGQTKWVWIFIHLFCVCLFSFQLLQLLPNLLSPTMTYTEVKDVPLKDLEEFPLDIMICVKPALDTLALQKFGYPSEYHYTVGLNEDESLVGWGGYNNQSEPVASGREVLSLTKRKITRDIILWLRGFHAFDGIPVDMTEDIVLENINQISECQILNFTTNGKIHIRELKRLEIFFNETLSKAVKLEIKLRGRTLASRREIEEHRFYSSGDALEVVDNIYSSYIVRIKTDVFVEEDPSKNCRNYPNPDFASFKECDDQYMRDKINEVAPGLTPPWLADDLDNITTQPIVYSDWINGNISQIHYL